MKRKYILSVAFIIITLPLFSQDTITKPPKRFKVYPFPAIGYAPETRWYFGGVVLLNMRFSGDAFAQTSTFETEFNYTQNKQMIFTANFDLQLFRNSFRWIGDNGFFRFPEDYWGIGNETPESNKVNYDANRIELDNSLLIKAKDHIYIGLRQRYHQIILKETIPGTGLPNEDDRTQASGIGPRFLADSRNNVLNATKGVYLSLNYQWYFPGFGSDDNFSKGELDIRFYQKIHKGGTIAVQTVCAIAHGNVPFRMYPLLGGENIMRGYYQGRYRDYGLAAVQGEYRVTLWRWLGAAAFGGAGRVFENDDQSRLWHPTYGGGLRIRIDKKENVNLRFDYARGDHSDGFYISFGEAF